jgi:hypothetical protein
VRGVTASQPFEQHHRVFLLFVAMMRKDGGELRVISAVRTLVVPVDGFELLLDGHDRAVHVDDITSQTILGLMEPLARAGHGVMVPRVRRGET